MPLKLDWEPFYSLPEGVEVAVGDRVSVLFSGKEYMAVVSKTNALPDASVSQRTIFPILEKVTELPRITELEMKFWRAVAGYYLCTPGEVYKTVYFQDRKPPRKWEYKDRSTINYEPLLSAENAYSGILDAFAAGKTVLLRGAGLEDVYLKLAVNFINGGKSVLYLVPDVAFTKRLEERVAAVFPDVMIYHSGLTEARRRDVVLEARSGKPVVVMGTRSALWIPFAKLGLVIVDQEHEVSFKQESPAPRYHARDAAIILASLCGANVLLGSSTPSLESQYNSASGLFARIEAPVIDGAASVTVIDSIAEKRKRGMVGELSLKLLAKVKQVKDAGGKVLVVCWNPVDIQDVAFATPYTVKSMPVDDYDLIAVLNAESLLGKEDFRSDERAYQLLRRLSAHCPLVVQTKDSAHPVFRALAGSNDLDAAMMAERQAFNYPPYTRLVSVKMSDTDESRLTLRSRLLRNRLCEALRQFGDPLILGPLNGETRIFFKRDRNLSAGKQALYKEVCSFEQQYSCHIVIDVDPV